MSRWIDVDERQHIISETVSSAKECRYLVNEVCTNDRSEQCCDFPHPDYCELRCPHFTKEDGIITK